MCIRDRYQRRVHGDIFHFFCQMMPSPPGYFYIHLRTAQINPLPNQVLCTEPFVRVTVGGKVKNSNRGIGREPQWQNERLAFFHDFMCGEFIVVEIFDYDARRPDDELIGGCEFEATMIKANKKIEGWYPIYYQGSTVGQIYLELEFVPSPPGRYERGPPLGMPDPVGPPPFLPFGTPAHSMASPPYPYPPSPWSSNVYGSPY
eukprot:TRINITY_DN19522_c0_g1_i1.p1 TRINITY_DN19522_c0_g1~~TRINITY_DN19522_c0_g1_i1.p1  ORF type:complete len:223 (-),score=52.64 TRINITY_DN19522_c0_g1_i1:122-730(-)